MLRNMFLVVGLSFFSVCNPVFAEQINLNAANQNALAEALSGVGPKRARAIVEYRQQYGPFKSVDDLDDVKGIGPKLLEKNRSLITVELPQ